MVVVTQSDSVRLNSDDMRMFRLLKLMDRRIGSLRMPWIVFRLAKSTTWLMRMFSLLLPHDDQILPFVAWFWDTLMIEAKTRAYRFQLDKDWFILDTNLLREALEITLIDQAHQFVSPPSGKTYGFDRPKYPVLQMLWGQEDKPHVIPYCRFTKLIIYYLGRIHNIHQRSGSPLNLAEDDLSLGNLKFVPKGEINEVFGMQIPKELITNNIRNAPYYNAYLEMVVKHNKKIPAENGGKKKSASKVDKTKKPVPFKKSKHAPAMKPKAHGQAPVGSVVIHEPVAEATRQLPIVKGKGKVIATDEQVAQSLLYLHKPKKTKEYVADKVNLEENTTEIDEGHARSDPGKTLESQPSQEGVLIEEDLAGPDSVQSHVALAGPGPEPMYDDFVTSMYLQKSLPEHVTLYKALKASMERANRDEFLVEKDNSRKRHCDDQDHPHPPLNSDLSKKKRHDSNASGSIQPSTPQSSAWKNSDTREAPLSSSKQKSISHSEQPVEDVSVPDDVNISDLEDTDTAHLLKIKTRPDWLKRTGDMSSFVNWFCTWIRKKKLSKANLKGPAFKEYDINAAYGITHWLFKRKEFYITRHSAPSDRRVVRSYMRILSVISLKTYERYGYHFLKENVLCRADYNEYKISKDDFKNLHLNYFKDLYLLHLQGQLNHLSSAKKVHLFNAVNLWIRNIVIKKHVEDLQLRIESYQTKLNLTHPDWDASDFLFKEDYTIVSKPRAVIYRDRNDQKKMMRETELIIIDAAHLKGTYLGTNIVIVGMDGNNQIIHIATGVAQGIIYPIRDVSSWHTPNDFPLLFPPILGNNLPGRPKTKDTIPSYGEGWKNNKCGRCGSKGHNRTACNVPVPKKQTTGSKRIKSTHDPSGNIDSQPHQDHQQPNQGYNVQMMYEPQLKTNNIDAMYQTHQEFQEPYSSDPNLNYLLQWSTPYSFLI
uniref:Uncharacterized protein n=1 Tax=Tanacetum cinerariifolium TaxID=118510 RepID=A0A6L2JL47_TANCI|nr:hypothetical protein [Tanacetum cinerariifolium]